MNYLIILLAIATFVATLIGGMVILRFSKGLPYFFAFAAGSLMGVAFLDIFPEALKIANNVNIPIRYIMATVVFSFFFYHFVERFFATHYVGGHDCEHHHHGHIAGPIGASSMVLHSFLDGAAIGAAFQVNAATGLVVALAVIFHDFTDGINTVTIMLKNKHAKKKAVLFLALDAIAPVLGVILLSFISIPEQVLAFVLAVFVGEFIYIGASNLLPETLQHNSQKMLIAMFSGIVLIYILTSFLA